MLQHFTVVVTFVMIFTCLRPHPSFYVGMHVDTLVDVVQQSVKLLCMHMNIITELGHAIYNIARIPPTENH